VDQVISGSEFFSLIVQYPDYFQPNRRPFALSSAGLLGLKDTELRSLGLSTELTPTADGVEYRLWAEKTQFDTTTVTFSQSYFGLPVWEAGLAVQMKLNPFRIISAQSTAHADVSAERPANSALRHLSNLNE
jgi:zinc metalloprotease ZmpB